DERASYQHHVLGLLRVRADRIRVAERAQVMDAIELGALDAQAPDVRAGCQERLAEAHLVARLQLRHALVRIEPSHARARQQLYVLLVLEFAGIDEDG